MAGSASVIRAVTTFFRSIFQCVGFAVIFVACVLISCVVYTQAHLALPAIYARGSLSYWLALTVTAWLGTGVWVNYFGSLGCDPGIVPHGWRDESGASTDAASGSRRRTCHTCKCTKTQRTHHCSFCGRCVQKMDHHCPWINSCVGYHNQRYFMGFLMYLLVGTAFCGAHFGYIMYHTDRYPRALHSANIVFIAGVICAALHFAMWFFVVWNMILVVTNQTSIEFQINRDEVTRRRYSGQTYRNPFDLGAWRNFLEVFVTSGDVSTYTLPPHPAHYSHSSVWARAWMGLRLAVTVVVYSLWLLVPNVQRMPHAGDVFARWRDNAV